MIFGDLDLHREEYRASRFSVGIQGEGAFGQGLDHQYVDIAVLDQLDCSVQPVVEVARAAADADTPLMFEWACHL